MTNSATFISITISKPLLWRQKQNAVFWPDVFAELLSLSAKPWRVDEQAEHPGATGGACAGGRGADTADGERWVCRWLYRSVCSLQCRTFLDLVGKTITECMAMFSFKTARRHTSTFGKMVSTADCALSATRTLLADTWSITFKVILFAF